MGLRFVEDAGQGVQLLGSVDQANLSFIPLDNGTFTATVTVTDTTNGATFVDSTEILVENAAPEIDVGPDRVAGA